MFLVGRVRRPHGLLGEVSVELVPGFPSELVPGSGVLWMRETELRSLTVSAVRPHAGRLLLRFEGIEGIESAGTLSGGDLCVAQKPANLGNAEHHEIIVRTGEEVEK